MSAYCLHPGSALLRMPPQVFVWINQNMLDLVGINLPHPYLVTPSAQAPLGLLYVMQGAKKVGFNVSVFDGTGKSPSELAKEVPSSVAYGISATVVDYPMALSVAKCLKAKNPKCKILLGGPIHTAIDYIDMTWFDSLIIGEAEEEIGNIVQDCVDNKLSRIYKCSCSNIDYVHPAYGLWKGPLGGKVLADEKYANAESSVILTSRGCPYSCVFCCAKTLCDGKVRFRNTDFLFEEIDYLARRGVRVLRLSDENFTTSKKHVYEFCERIRPYYEKYELVWRPSFRVDSSDLEMLKVMRASGCVEASIGIESTDQTVLDTIQKKTTVEQGTKALQELKEAGIFRRVLFMTGCPGTNHQTLLKNARFILDETKYDIISITVFTPLPGTPIWDNPAKFRCSILEHARHLENLCFYFFSPEGTREIEPFISLWDFPYEDLKLEVNTTRGLIQAVGKVNKG